MLAAMEGARSQLEKHLQNLHAVLDAAGELGMGAGGRLGAGGCGHQDLGPCPAGSSPGAISTLHGSCFILLSAFLVPTWPRAAILLLLFLASSTLGIPALSALLALAMAGGDGCGGTWLGTHRPGGATGVGCEGAFALSHPLASPQGSGWWRWPAAVLRKPGQRFPATSSPPPRTGRRWLWGGGWAQCPWELLRPNLGAHPGCHLPLPPGRGPQGGLPVPGRVQDTS